MELEGGDPRSATVFLTSSPPPVYLSPPRAASIASAEGFFIPLRRRRFDAGARRDFPRTAREVLYPPARDRSRRREPFTAGSKRAMICKTDETTEASSVIDTITD